MKVLITGARGFIGSALVGKLINDGHHVFACIGSSNSPISFKANKGNLNILYGNLLSDIKMPSTIDAVVHAAAQSPTMDTSATSMLHNNIYLTDKLISYAKIAGAKRFIYLSSISVYGEIKAKTVLETTPIINPDFYGTTKRIGEQLLEAEASSFSSVSIRLPGVIGPKSVRNWMTHVMHAARNGDMVLVYNPYEDFNNAAHVEDVGDFVSSLISTEWHGSEVVNIGALGKIPVLEAMQIIVNGFGGRSEIIFEPSTKSSFTISSEKAVNEFRYKPMRIDAMLRRFVKENII